MHAFRFKYRPQPVVFKEWRQTDYIITDPQEIASRSRDKDKVEVVGTLLRHANNADLVVVAIVGMGGIGKTTLAQLIYNEPGIQKHFQLLLWVCVSDTFDVNSLAKSIVDASPKKNDDANRPPLERLQKLVSGQRYLLVLDDVWNREAPKWGRLKDHFKHGGMGSAVLTTTHDKGVAKIMGADTHLLGRLEDRFLKEIIEAGAFSFEKKKPAELAKMVHQIVIRCCGSPLAASALGSILRTKTSVKEWKAIASRSSICTEETGTLPILKLSYNDLSSHMKQCFAYCVIFPKDYKIDVAKLIQLWIANGFIPEHKEDSLEAIGQLIFDELASRSFFLDIEKSKDIRGYYSKYTCKIHDLMHDIAMSIMEKECVVATVEPSKIEWPADTTRHLFLSCPQQEGILNDFMEKRSPAIQTLICDSYVQCPLQHLS
uniref:NB-ARC domain-containing protein n=2 Tax=Triticum urartu TaxID=4572 RepID=A0A8R7JVD7_TRIUA